MVLILRLFFLQNLITSETSMFDVLPEFFYHHNEIVRMAALEVNLIFNVHQFMIKQICCDFPEKKC